MPDSRVLSDEQKAIEMWVQVMNVFIGGPPLSQAAMGYETMNKEIKDLSRLNFKIQPKTPNILPGFTHDGGGVRSASVTAHFLTQG
jgi:hypothetical protein